MCVLLCGAPQGVCCHAWVLLQGLVSVPCEWDWELPGLACFAWTSTCTDVLMLPMTTLSRSTDIFAYSCCCCCLLCPSCTPLVLPPFWPTPPAVTGGLLRHAGTGFSAGLFSALGIDLMVPMLHYMGAEYLSNMMNAAGPATAAGTFKATGAPFAAKMLKRLGVKYNIAMLRCGGTQSASALGREFGVGFSAQLVQNLGVVFVAQLTAALGGEFASIIANSLGGKGSA